MTSRSVVRRSLDEVSEATHSTGSNPIASHHDSINNNGIDGNPPHTGDVLEPNSTATLMDLEKFNDTDHDHHNLEITSSEAGDAASHQAKGQEPLASLGASLNASRSSSPVQQLPPTASQSCQLSLCTAPYPRITLAKRRDAQATQPTINLAPDSLAEHRQQEQEQEQQQHQPKIAASSPETSPASTITPPFQEALEHIPSAPIDIPCRSRNNSNRSPSPSTPLTARDNNTAGHWFPFSDRTPERPQISDSLKPRYQRPKRKANSPASEPSTTLPTPQALLPIATTMRPEPTGARGPPYAPVSPPYRPSTTSSIHAGISTSHQHSEPSQSSNSSTMPSPATLRPSIHTRRTPQNLHLPSLPRFHPANYQSNNSSSLATSPVRTRPPSSYRPPRSPRGPASGTGSSRQLSDAQAKLQQYQREVLSNVARSAALVTSPGSSASTPKPHAPLLRPCGSPGPATPLALDGESDYMTAGPSASQVALGEGSPRDLVDRMIRDERERSLYSGGHSGPSSPAVSPAGAPY
ncbi:hypothetical protein MMC09_000127 [Bachmanniomyces sp. S44760]|nr:hypothetical protein [Bachmanniomyces sp. S44760]